MQKTTVSASKSRAAFLLAARFQCGLPVVKDVGQFSLEAAHSLGMVFKHYRQLVREIEGMALHHAIRVVGKRRSAANFRQRMMPAPISVAP
jgi:hypothetical protein